MGSTQLKQGVRLDGLQPAGARIFATVDNCARSLNLDQLVTCGTDSHGPSDPHTRGVALDIGVKRFTPSVTVKVYAYLSAALGSLFTVLYETPELPLDPDLQAIATVNPKASAPHVHIQLKKGISDWPPVHV